MGRKLCTFCEPHLLRCGPCDYAIIKQITRGGNLQQQSVGIFQLFQVDCWFIGHNEPQRGLRRWYIQPGRLAADANYELILRARMKCPAGCGTFPSDQTLATIPLSTVNAGIQFPDEEGDGIPNIFNRDDDNDGRADVNDRNPFDPAVQ